LRSGDWLFAHFSVREEVVATRTDTGFGYTALNRLRHPSVSPSDDTFKPSSLASPPAGSSLGQQFAKASDRSYGMTPSSRV
jgi:hypothetical protein